MITLAREDPRIRTLNDRSFEDRRVKVVNADAFGWLRDNSAGFDAVIVDLPDPDETATAKLYSTEFYTLLRPSLAPGAVVVVQAGSPYFAPKSYWCIEASLRAAGFATTPYHVDVPSFGDWGFMLATPGPEAPILRLPSRLPDLRYLTPAVLAAATVFPPDRGRLPVEPSTLLQPRILEYARGEWRGY
jgi:spermidine synthase